MTAPSAPGGSSEKPGCGEEPREAEQVGGRAMGLPVRIGVTEPISLGMPTGPELALNDQLLEELRRDAPLDTEDGMRFRTSVLVELERIVLQWIYEVCIQQGLDEVSAKEAGAKIFTFGSYRLGLVNPGSDIDALCVAPRNVTRDTFFQVLAPKLQEHPDITELTPVPDAYVPIIKMKFSGVEIDLLFGRLNLPQIPHNLDSLADDNLLKNLDEKTVRSLNGCRVADHILASVPHQDRFRETLRLVKIWAKRRAIYSNVLGFFGGITWAILVARVCQLYPYYCPAALVNRFFRLYDRWNWKNPVVLCSIRQESNEPGLMAFKVWNPKVHPEDRLHLMPVITPSFPSMNSTHNVTHTTQRIIMQEFARGYQTVQLVEQGKCSWSEVYRPLPFFRQYKQYLHIEVVAKSSQAFTKWMGWIETKIRHLAKNLEQIPSILVRPWADHIKFQDPKWPFAKSVFLGLRATKAPEGVNRGKTIDIKESVTKFVEIINSWNERAATWNICEMRVNVIKRHELPDHAPDPDGSRARAVAAAAAAAAAAAEEAPAPAPPAVARLPVETSGVAAEMLPQLRPSPPPPEAPAPPQQTLSSPPAPPPKKRPFEPLPAAEAPAAPPPAAPPRKKGKIPVKLN